MMRPFVTKRMHVHFAKGCQGLLGIEVWISTDDEAPSSGEPSGVNLLDDYGQVGRLVGDGQTKILEHSVDQREGGSFLKVRAVNNDWYDHGVNVEVEIEVDS